ncbi:MAG: response regulator [Candidatus Desantisbacteria bacterium]
MAKILIIDDEPLLVMAMKIRLESVGYEVISAYDGQEGLTKAQEEHPDLIILDVMLPKKNGYQICQQLKFDEQYKHIPIIMLTAKTQKMDKKYAQQAGADFYITKPFENKELLAKIRELIER